MTKRDQKVFDWLKANPGWHKPSIVGVGALGLEPNQAAGTASRCLTKLQKEGHVLRNRDGQFKVRER